MTALCFIQDGCLNSCFPATPPNLVLPRDLLNGLWGIRLLSESRLYIVCLDPDSTLLALPNRPSGLTFQPDCLPLMQALVSHQMLLTGEALWAERAPVGPLARVQSPVGGEVLLTDERLPALPAGVWPLPGVDHLVP